MMTLLGFRLKNWNRSDPSEAIEKFNPYYYDLIVTDIKMPGMNGFQLCGRIKE